MLCVYTFTASFWQELHHLCIAAVGMKKDTWCCCRHIALVENLTAIENCYVMRSVYCLPLRHSDHILFQEIQDILMLAPLPHVDHHHHADGVTYTFFAYREG